MLHLYVNFTGVGGCPAVTQLGPELAEYVHAGFQIEIVLCYRPRDGGSSEQVAGFARFAKDAVRSLGSSRALVSLQVTNEANVAGSTNMTDGSYKDVSDALIAGVIAAKHEARQLGFSWLKVGFNWAYGTDPRQRGSGDIFIATGALRSPAPSTGWEWTYIPERGGRRSTSPVSAP